MYINWPHYYIPKFNGLCSFLVNPIFIFIIFADKRLQLGNYRCLLLYFAIFNMICSACDILVPVCVHDHRYAFSVFTSDGLFEKRICNNVTAYSNKFLAKYFLPYGMIASIVYCLFHMVYWIVACFYFIGADRERKLYMRETIQEVYGLDSLDINMIIALYREGSYDAVQKSLIGVVSITFLSVDSVIIYFILGLLIMKRLGSNTLIMSKKTKKLQAQLMKALIVQSVIPTVVSFAPCIFSWYQPVFGIELGRSVYHSAAIAVSAFPFLDPLAILFFVPTFRQRFKEEISRILLLRNLTKRCNPTAETVSSRVP
ncbi:hypothetical protein GCK72_020213 [Caenorhabditis remanei]|uniref:Uncharacterized protein n=1 Tax=Caenorhabditis remanei TaxID=31234 RepID=A0A6A5GG19_CAERE|nr:hypothetical protein GCK72_020213 [Caenorhabditis remanei]KAF1753656.1 hypothetical protein GCK72_020213 [Caenorhabditis remanei]